MPIDREKCKAWRKTIQRRLDGEHCAEDEVINDLFAQLDAKDAEIGQLKVCPVCDEIDPDGLEACSKCYCEQIKDGEIRQLKAEIERLKKLNAHQAQLLEVECRTVERQIVEIERLKKLNKELREFTTGLIKR